MMPSRRPVSSRLAMGKVRHAPRRQEPLAHHLREVVDDLRARRQLLHPPVQPGRVRAARAQRAGVHAVVGRRLVQAHERVRVVPVASGGVSAVHHDDARVGLVEQRVHERHGGCAGADDEVVGLNCLHRHRPLVSHSGRPYLTA